MQKSLFNKPKPHIVVQGIRFNRVSDSDYEILRKIESMRKGDIPYYIFASHYIHYWNKGIYELYINEDWESTKNFIPIAKKHKNAVSYHIPGPIVDDVDLLVRICNELEKSASRGVFVKYVDPNSSISTNSDFVYTGKEVEYIYSAKEQSELKGGTFKKIRRKLIEFERFGQVAIRKLDRNDIELHEKFLDQWMEEVGPSYFRPSVMKDRRLMQWNIEGDDYDFSIVAIFEGKIIGVSHVSRTYDKLQCCEVYQKVLRGYPNVSQALEKYGADICYADNPDAILNNSSASATSKGIRAHKESRKPCRKLTSNNYRYEPSPQ